ncbi:MAG: class I SAM-dependent methyltransferase [Verrucomicrobiota bacterium]
MSAPDATSRFSSRVQNYVRYRPSYPPGVLDTLERTAGLKPGAEVADIGAGTGIFSRLLLERGWRVRAVEPNDAMRAALDEALGERDGISSRAAPAEATGLPEASVDLVTVAHAFHWFDPDKFRAECARILRPGGWVGLVWNERLTETSAFARRYEALLQEYGTDYAAIDHRNVDEAAIARFFSPQPFRQESFPFVQRFDYTGLEGRTLSSSYVPLPDAPNFAPMIAALKELFQSEASAGEVSFDYKTTLFFGQLG